MAYSLTLGAISFLLSVIWGVPLISALKKYKIGQQIRVEGPSTHQVKAGTPTMGGLLMVVPILLITGVLNIGNWLGLTLIGRSILVPMGIMASFAVVGVIDDLATVKSSMRGLSARTKFGLQFVLAAVATLIMSLGDFQYANAVALPGQEDLIKLSPVIYAPVAIFIILGTSNAVNLADGLDGLAGSLAMISFVAYGVIAFLQGQIWLVAFTLTVVGAIMAFLWYNAYPAELFMGEVGSGTLGATLAVVALMSGQWLLLPIVGIMFVAEAASVILQVGYFKWSKGKRLFKMSPLHNHFELSGWSETQITQRFWLLSILAAMIGIALALI
ncbi:MAG TPA: phospho-N-acetylmuramoyl-pentapeptide-transferase [Anaerolineae bacterium]|nr:phospho-N-acetylmuramoyl-pentapeptide-transferase [Anaerolineae bacterium]